VKVTVIDKALATSTFNKIIKSLIFWYNSFTIELLFSIAYFKVVFDKDAILFSADEKAVVMAIFISSVVVIVLLQSQYFL
jgi:hypothetical protein